MNCPLQGFSSFSLRSIYIIPSKGRDQIYLPLEDIFNPIPTVLDQIYQYPLMDTDIFNNISTFDIYMIYILDGSI